MGVVKKGGFLSDMYTNHTQGKLDSSVYVKPSLPKAKKTFNFEETEVKKQIDEKAEELNTLLKSLEQPMQKYNIALGALSLLSL